MFIPAVSVIVFHGCRVVAIAREAGGRTYACSKKESPRTLCSGSFRHDFREVRQTSFGDLMDPMVGRRLFCAREPLLNELVLAAERRIAHMAARAAAREISQAHKTCLAKQPCCQKWPRPISPVFKDMRLHFCARLLLLTHTNLTGIRRT